MDASFHFKHNYVTPFTVLYNAIVCKTAIVSVNVIINSFTQNYLIVHSIMHVIFNQLFVCDTILIDGNCQQHNRSLVTLVVLSDLCQENNYCKTASLNACGLLLSLWTNLENISRILIFADLDLPRNCAKIGRCENFPFYGNSQIKTKKNLKPFTLQALCKDPSSTLCILKEI